MGIVVSVGKAEASPTRRESATKQWSIPSKLTLAVLPVSVVAILSGLLLGWNMVPSDGPGLQSGTGILAVVIVLVVALAAVASLVAVYRIGRSISRRTAQVSSAAKRVTSKDLVHLLDTLRSPQPDIEAIAPLRLDREIQDEVGELARSFEEFHRSLIEVGARQIESLRAGVSSIFATLARRNSSLVDRQLAVLDKLESREEDPEVLSGYYQVDHLATRMRRNAESLLVLAGSESPRIWTKHADISVVVRAAVSEVDEYQRVEVVALEPARLSGGAVTDLTHLVAELLENAVEFSPPTEPVRVTGLFNVEGYQLSISDRGVGMSPERIGEMNRILEKPPSLGLSVEPTMGMFVVAKLAHRHGFDVELIPGVPGLTAQVTIPRDHLVAEKPSERPAWDAESGEDEVDGDGERSVRVRTGGTSMEPVGASQAELVHEVIDLTQPEMTEPSVAAPPGPGPKGDLPVRTPGQTFRAEDPTESSAAGEAPGKIRSALSAYEQGRRAAAATDQHDEAETSAEDDSD